jgi:hypothetical protein
MRNRGCWVRYPETHDNGVFAAVRIVAPPDAQGLKVKTAVDGNGAVVGPAHLQKNFFRPFRPRVLDDILEQPAAYAPAPLLGVDGQIEDMRLFRH